MIKKRLLHICSLISFALMSFNVESKPILNNKNFYITGVIQEESVVVLRYENIYEKMIEDTCTSKNGLFYFSGQINKVSKANLYIYSSDRAKSNLKGEFSFFISEGEIKVMIDTSCKSIKVDGTPINYENEKLNYMLEDLDKKIASANVQYKTLQEKNADSEEKNYLKKNIDSLINQRIVVRKNFADTHPTSFLSPELISFLFMRREITYDTARKMRDNLSTNVIQSSFGISLERGLEKYNLSKVGMPAPLFSKKDIYGKDIKLSDFKNKNYILLNYWASYCLPCRSHVADLKQFYEKYNPKGLEIIAISWDFNEKNCLEAIQKDKTTDWINIFGLSNKNDTDPFLTSYSIPYIPVYILIDEKGIIINRTEDGNLIKLGNKLNEIFNAN